MRVRLPLMTRESMYKKTILVVVSLCVASSLVAENIQFADGGVKTACIDNWDTDKDGELSMEEAAAVTTLGNVFRARKSVTEFPELRFFTGLTAIDDYAFYQSSIQSVAFPPTVTAIGAYAFSQSSIGPELRIPGTVTDIAKYAFNSCKCLTAVILEEGVQTVGWHCFSGPISTLWLPKSLTFISSMAIDPYVSGDSSMGMFVPEGDLWVFAQAETPATINDFAFYYLFFEGHLVVPFDALEEYRAAEPWSQFGQYVGIGDVNADGTIDEADVQLLTQYLAGEDVTLENEYLADVNGNGTVNTNDVAALQDLLHADEGIITGVKARNMFTANDSQKVYSLDGRVVANSSDALSSLPDGIYICRGRKIVVRSKR